jgi:hypothetical protein
MVPKRNWNRRTEYTSKEKTADENLQKTTKELYKLEKKVSAARKKLAEDDTTDKASSKKELATAVDELEKGKDKWIEERRVLQAAQSRKAMAEMEMTGRENMLNSVKNRISQLDRQIEAIEAQIRASSVPARGLPSAIIDIDANRNIIHADHSCLVITINLEVGISWSLPTFHHTIIMIISTLFLRYPISRAQRLGLIVMEVRITIDLSDVYPIRYAHII